MRLDIDDRDLRRYTMQLEQMHKKHLPLAVKGALNKAAVSMKLGKRHIQKEFKDEFVIRRPKFINAHTGFEKIPFSEWDISRMASKAGIIKGKSKAGDRLKLQEEGGTLKRRQAPSKHTRIGSNDERKQKAQYYFKKYKNKPLGRILKTNRLTVIKTRRNLLSVAKGGEWKTLYTLVPNVKIKKRPFVSTAGKIAARDINKYYIEEATKRINQVRF